MPYIISIIIFLVLLYIILKALKVSIKFIFKLIINSIIGAVILLICNWIPFVMIPITWWSCLLVGFLGVPAALILALLSIFKIL